MQTVLDAINKALGEQKPLKSLLIAFAVLALLSLTFIQILPFLIFLLLAIIVYLQIPKKK
ncbi:hypothetical protein IPM65_04455 [Candidatus Roizmanbacteria bacterium]|nr:MAG: hypothetical protein IPM65_04455 [Candidatus Roizmanbacteria bacterium]